MPSTEELKTRVCEAIDRHRERIIAVGEAIMDDPELGFKEERTARRVAALLRDLGVVAREGLALTGVKAVLKGGSSGPRVALLGEMDALLLPQHRRANQSTGAAHACGHNAQIAGMLGAALGLTSAAVMPELCGSVVLMAVPAEEYVELEYRLGLVRTGTVGLPAGKPELIRLGHFDDVDMALMVHTSSPVLADGSVGVAASSNGFVGKTIRFIGTAAHAGGNPERGVNALNAATLAIAAIHAHRETFRDEDRVRVHPIITRGGDLVNIVPADVRLETYVRAKTWEAIVDAAARVDRAVKGAALAIGCSVEIETVPGYLPLRNDPNLARLFRANAARLFAAEEYREHPHSCGSTDAGDLSQIMPVLHPAMAGAAGGAHAPEWTIADPEQAYVAPAKALAMMVIDLLTGGAAEARRVLHQSRPALSREEYVRRQLQLFRTEVFDGATGGAVADEEGEP